MLSVLVKVTLEDEPVTLRPVSPETEPMFTVTTSVAVELVEETLIVSTPAEIKPPIVATAEEKIARVSVPAPPVNESPAFSVVLLAEKESLPSPPTNVSRPVVAAKAWFVGATGVVGVVGVVVVVESLDPPHAARDTAISPRPPTRAACCA
jgi:hypothetical protein